MKRFSVLAALLIAAGQAQAALQPGDIAFTSFNADEDGFSIVALAPVAPFTAVYFSDNEWNGGAPGAGSFNGGEGTYAWVSGASEIHAGTVVRFSSIDSAGRAATLGAFGQVLTGLPGFAATGDTLFAYAGNSPSEPAALLAAISSDAFNGSSLTGTGLEVGVNSVSVGAGADYAEYTGTRSGLPDFASYRALIADASQWNAHASGDFAAFAPNMVPFAVAAVPEPQTYALLATGLCLVALRLKQRRLRTTGRLLAEPRPVFC